MTKKQTTNKASTQTTGTTVHRRTGNGYGTDVKGGEAYDRDAEYNSFGFRGSDAGWAARNPGRTPRG
jgi:hypothetical protein